MNWNQKIILLITAGLSGCVIAASAVQSDQDQDKEETKSAPVVAAKTDEPVSKLPVGMAAKQPDSGPFVKVESGFMVPYKATIPGTDVQFEMVPIPGGTFMMGSPEDEDGRITDEGPQVEVKVAPFWMGKHEVTWAEYYKFMQLDKVFKAFQQKKIRQVTKANEIDAITAPSALYDPSFTFDAGEGPDEPAATITQFAAKQYTKWVSGLTTQFYRLPYEAEWEYACRAGTTTPYYFGDDPDELEKHAWIYDNSDEMRHPVGQLKPNPFGLYDMYGNVSEWVLDQYTEDGFKHLAGKTGLTAATSFNKPTQLYPRVVRGGSFESEEVSECRSASRMGSDDEEWRDEDPNVPKSPWWYTTSPALGVGFRMMRPYKEPETRQMKETFWAADLEDIIYDAKNRINDNGRGGWGIVGPDLPKAISELTDEDR